MAVDMFLKIETVDGEAIDSDHKNEIDIQTWTWGMSQSGTMHYGGGGGSGKVSISDVNVTKTVDKSSPILMKSCANGKHFPEAKITVRKAGEKAVEYVIITMTDVMITAINSNGAGNQDTISETVTLNFAKVNYEYTPQTKDGSPQASIEFEHNIEENITS